MSGDLVFYGFALLTILSAFAVVFMRNIVHAGFSLLFTLFGVAGLYALLGADFLAVTQTIVYIGGILILVLFVVMMTRIPGPQPGINKVRTLAAAVFSLGILALMYKIIFSAGWLTITPDAPSATITEIGTKLLTDYIFPFEFASLVLLVAMIGAAIMIRERKQDAATEEQS
jgi:NADH-quinone oxidoreductase subunit J